MKLPRYPKYKDSGVEWVGAIPDGWQAKPLFAVALERAESNSGMIENNLLSLSYGRIVKKDIESDEGLLPASFETYQIVRPDDLVFRLTDLQNDKRSLRTAIVGERGIITSAYLAVKVFGAHPEFLHFLLRAYDLCKVFYSMGGGLRQSMNFADVRRLPILFPSPNEQERIAKFLRLETAKIDGLIADQLRLIEFLKEKRQAVNSRAVTKGLNPNAPMKPSGIEWLGEVPAHWTLLRVKHMTSFITSGPRGWAEFISESGNIFVQSGDLDDELNIRFTDCKRVQVQNSAEATRTLLRNGDVVVCITGAKTGNVAICEDLDEPAYVNQHLCLIRPNERVLPRFLGFALKSGAGQSHLALSQSGLKQGLGLEDIKETPIFVPPVSEQKEIVAFMDSEGNKLRRAREYAEKAIQLLQERRSALISAAVTGKIDVRGLVSTEAA